MLAKGVVAVVDFSIVVCAVLGLVSFLEIGSSLYAYKPLFLVFLILVLVLWLFQHSKQVQRVPSATSGLFFVLYGWVLLSTPSFFAAASFREGILINVSYIVLGTVAFLLLPVYSTSTQRESIEPYSVRFNRLFFWAFFSIIVLGVALSFSRSPLFIVYPGTGRIRYFASFVNPNYLGLFSFVGIVIATKLSLAGHKKYLWATLPLGILLYLSDSRTSFAATLIVYAVFSFLLLTDRVLKRYRLVVYGLTTTAITLGSVVLMMYVLTGANGLSFDQLDILLSGRWRMWADALQPMSGHYWLIGQGIGNAGQDLRLSTSNSFENYYLAQYVQTGLLGFLGLLLLIIAVLRACLRIEVRTVRYYTLAVIIGWISVSMVESQFFTTGNPASVYIWCELGVLLASQPKSRLYSQPIAP